MQAQIPKSFPHGVSSTVDSLFAEIVALLQLAHKEATEGVSRDAVHWDSLARTQLSGLLREFVQVVAAAMITDAIATKTLLTALDELTALKNRGRGSSEVDWFADEALANRAKLASALARSSGRTGGKSNAGKVRSPLKMAVGKYKMRREWNPHDAIRDFEVAHKIPNGGPYLFGNRPYSRASVLEALREEHRQQHPVSRGSSHARRP